MNEACIKNTPSEAVRLACAQAAEKIFKETLGAASKFKITPLNTIEVKSGNENGTDADYFIRNRLFCHQQSNEENEKIYQELDERVCRHCPEMEESNRKLREIYEQLVRSEKLASLGELVAEVGHELNNKLMPVLAYAQLLKEQNFPEDVLHYLDIIEQSASAATSVVNSLLNFARPSRCAREPVDLNGTMRETLELLEYRLKKGKAHLQVDLSKDIPITIADEKQIAQVFLNIINNAVQAMEPNGGRLVVRSSWREENIIFTITDSGSGISPADLPRIFEPFFSTKGKKGTGLGLSVSKRLIEAHSGEILVKSTARLGTTFTVTLPIKKNEDVREAETWFGHEAL